MQCVFFCLLCVLLFFLASVGSAGVQTTRALREQEEAKKGNTRRANPRMKWALLLHRRLWRRFFFAADARSLIHPCPPLFSFRHVMFLHTKKQTTTALRRSHHAHPRPEDNGSDLCIRKDGELREKRGDEKRKERACRRSAGQCFFSPGATAEQIFNAVSEQAFFFLDCFSLFYSFADIEDRREDDVQHARKKTRDRELCRTSDREKEKENEKTNKMLFFCRRRRHRSFLSSSPPFFLLPPPPPPPQLHPTSN